MSKILAVMVAVVSAGQLGAADAPSAEIGNGQLRAKVYLPDAKQGFYRGTRFDWSGVIYSLEAHGHNYYGPWFNKTDPTVHDFEYRGDDIVAGPCSAITGPVDEFAPLGWDDAQSGGTFIKIGIGALRKPDGAAYDNYRVYEIADGGKWSVHQKPDGVEFVQELQDAGSGYGYVYRKTVQFSGGKTEMVLSHSLKNTGQHAIKTSVYNHNFLVLDGATTGPDFSIALPFTIHTPKPPAKDLAAVEGNKIVYLKMLAGRDVATTPIEGFGNRPNDYEFRIENAKLGAGIHVQGDRPLLRESLWSIRTVIAVEPFIEVKAAPGEEFHWKTVYEYYSTGAR